METPSTGLRSWQVLPRHSADAVVAWRGRDPFTAAALLFHTSKIAAHLPAAGPGEEVLVLCTDRYAFAASALAAWSAGYSIALPPNARPRIVSEIMNARAIKTVVHDGGAEGGVDVRSILASPLDRSAESPEDCVLNAERRIATLYTSGSSGEERPCPKTAGQLFGEAALLGATLGIQPEDRVLATVPPQHIYGLLMGVLVPLGQGASIVCGTPLHAESIAACALEFGATVVAGVPVHLRALATLGGSELKRIRLFVSSGAPLKPRWPRASAELRRRPWSFWDRPETGGVALRQPPEEWWRPLPGVSVSADPEGALPIDSPFLDPGTVRPHRGADRIELTGAGLFKHLGRLDGVIKIAGTRVDLNEMERRLRALEGVEDAALAAIPVSGGRGSEIWAMVVAPGLDTEAIRKGLLEWFEPVSLPRRFRWVDQIPRETTGKLPLARWQQLFGGRVVASRRDFEVTGRSATDAGDSELREVFLSVPEELCYFEGHFEGFPVLSGVVILNNLVLAECRRAWPDLNGLRQVSRLKFRRPIHPGAALALGLVRRHGEHSVDFDLTSAGDGYNSGTLVFEQPQ